MNSDGPFSEEIQMIGVVSRAGLSMLRKRGIPIMVWEGFDSPESFLQKGP
jgi:hypothetical protein